MTAFLRERDLPVRREYADACFGAFIGGLTSAPNPYLDEFEWGAKEPAVEIQFKNTTGYQAFAFDVAKAFNGKLH